MAARTGVQPGDFDSTGATRELETTGHSDRLWELFRRKIEYLWDLFLSPREFPIQLSPVFRMVFQRMTDIEKGFADNHGDRRISDVPAFFRGLSFRRFRRKR
jgi:hypothetical protein